VKLSKKTFIITGGGSGLGAATARLFVEGGANVVLCDINAEAGDKTASAIGDNAKFVQCDVVDEDQVQAAVDAAAQSFGTLDGVVCCAGVGGSARVAGREAAYPLDQFKRIMDINVIGTFNAIRLSAMVMTKNEPGEDGERGVVINTASVAAYEGQIGQAAYSASKGAIIAMTLPIAREFAQHGIRVVTIAPGLFDTPLLGRHPEEKKQALAMTVPFPKRLGRADEFASLAKQIVENGMLNGETIRLDGAIRMEPK
jgi:NAD(P)-dependent dehydrogenase (short-subunit alcohol dehydrogenase family)